MEYNLIIDPFMITLVTFRWQKSSGKVPKQNKQTFCLSRSPHFRLGQVFHLLQLGDTILN